jgi:protein-L-isoaspartate(D-aspartate) O-methyltransferase
VTAVAAKAIAAAHYGKPLQQAYFNGCSNGGRQAMMEVQRYPDDFDGVIAGHPANGTPMQAGRVLLFQHMLASIANYLPGTKIDVLARATLAACDASDGLKDGLVTDPRLCRFSPDALKCEGADRADCLTNGQLETVKRVYSGSKAPTGEELSPPMPLGHEDGSTGWRQWIVGNDPPISQSNRTLEFGPNPPAGFRLSEQNFRFLALDQDDPTFNWRTFNLERDFPRLATMTEILSPLNPDLAPFRKRNGKLIIYHGWADAGISAFGTLSYYDRVVEKAGGQRDADSFVRLFMAPGMHHCAGGPGPNTFDMLTVLEEWVERGVAPERVVASHRTDGRVDRTRPLCAHPKVARYTGSGSIDAESSFTCEAPQAAPPQAAREREPDRRRMVENQIRARGVTDERVLRAIGRVPRHLFVPPDVQPFAYEDRPLPIGHQQTISQPFVVAYMTEALEVAADHSVLEIGTGSGYQAAVLAELARQVYSIEIVPELAKSARATLASAGYSNVQVREGNGYLGWPEQAPFPRIIVTAAPPEIPKALVEQLAVGGKMVVPVGTNSQEIVVVTKTNKGITEQRTIPVRFVPMVDKVNKPPR